MNTPPDDASDWERRLAGLAPAADGLDDAAMLFAAGRASARPGPARFFWPALAVVLGVWLAAERSERLELARQLRAAPAALAPPPSPRRLSIRPGARRTDRPTACSPPARPWSAGLDAWPPRPLAPAEAFDPPVFRAGQRDNLLDS